MAVKKAVKKEETVEVEKAAPKKAVKKATPKKKSADVYFYAVGRRKASIAQVRLYESEATEADYLINDKKFKDYFPTLSIQNIILAPLRTVGMTGKVNMTVKVSGGGFTGQSEAVRLGISRALVKMNETFKKSIKDAGFLTRDSREVERKKPGLKKARRAPQWAKR